MNKNGIESAVQYMEDNDFAILISCIDNDQEEYDFEGADAVAIKTSEEDGEFEVDGVPYEMLVDTGRLKNGLTKVVYLLFDGNVLKTNATGVIENDLYGKDNIFDDSMNEFDYCDKEVAVAKIAKDQGLGEFFADSQWVDGTNEKVMWQEGCIPYDDEIEEYSIKELKNFGYKFPNLTDEERCHYLDLLDDIVEDREFANDIIDCYGVEKIFQLREFMIFHNLHNDMHSGNFGYRVVDMTPVFFDISGYGYSS